MSNMERVKAGYSLSSKTMQWLEETSASSGCTKSRLIDMLVERQLLLRLEKADDAARESAIKDMIHMYDSLFAQNGSVK